MTERVRAAPADFGGTFVHSGDRDRLPTASAWRATARDVAEPAPDCVRDRRPMPVELAGGRVRAKGASRMFADASPRPLRRRRPSGGSDE